MTQGPHRSFTHFHLHRLGARLDRQTSGNGPWFFCARGAVFGRKMGKCRQGKSGKLAMKTTRQTFATWPAPLSFQSRGIPRWEFFERNGPNRNGALLTCGVGIEWHRTQRCKPPLARAAELKGAARVRCFALTKKQKCSDTAHHTAHKKRFRNQQCSGAGGRRCMWDLAPPQSGPCKGVAYSASDGPPTAKHGTILRHALAPTAREKHHDNKRARERERETFWGSCEAACDCCKRLRGAARTGRTSIQVSCSN